MPESNNIKANNNVVAKFLIAIYLFALLVRVIFAVYLPPKLIWPDETGYCNIGINLASGEGYTNELNDKAAPYFSDTKFNKKESFYFAPGLSFTLAAIFAIMGNDLTTTRITQAFIAALLPIVIFFLSSRLFKSRKVAYISSIITAIYPFYIYFSSMFLPQTIFSVLLALTLYFFISWLRDGRTYWLILTAVTNGVACLFVVPMIFTVIPILAIIFHRSFRQRSLRLDFVVFVLCWILVVSPYLIYASKANDEFIMITKQGDPLVIIKHNHPNLSANEIISHSFSEDSKVKINQLRVELMSSSHPRTAAIVWFRKMIVKHPLLFLRNCLLRIAALFAPITFTITKTTYSGPVVNVVNILVYFPLFLLSILGLTRMTKNKDRIGLLVLVLLAFFMIPHILIVANTRYRIPWDTLIICYAAYFLSNQCCNLWQKLQKICNLHK